MGHKPEPRGRTLRKLAWVKVNFESLHPSQLPHYEHYKGLRFIYLGEIPNQPGHALILDATNQLHGKNAHIILHTEELVELTDDEV